MVMQVYKCHSASDISRHGNMEVVPSQEATGIPKGNSHPESLSLPQGLVPPRPDVILVVWLVTLNFGISRYPLCNTQRVCCIPN